MTWDAVGRSVILRPSGDLCEGPATEDMENTLLPLVRNGRRVIVNLCATRQLTARAIGILAQACDDALHSGGAIAVCGASTAQQWVLRLTRLTDVIELYDTEAAALAADRVVA